MPPPSANIDEEKCFDKKGEKNGKDRKKGEGAEIFFRRDRREKYIIKIQDGWRGYCYSMQDTQS